MRSPEHQIVFNEYMRLYRLAFPEICRAVYQRSAFSDKGKATRLRYAQSAHGKNVMRRLQRSGRYRAKQKQWREATKRTEGGRAAYLNGQRKYSHSPKGRITRAAFASRYRAARFKQAVAGCEQSIKKIYARASELRQWFNVVVDHIIPISKGGLHAPGNLQIIYRAENAIKSARLDYVPSVIFA